MRNASKAAQAIALIAVAIFATGCASIDKGGEAKNDRIQCTKRLPNGTRVCYASPVTIWRKCFGLPESSDPPRDSSGRVNLITQACWIETDTTIYTEDTYCGWRFAAYHERRHEQGIGHGEDDNPEDWDWNAPCPITYK